MIKFLLFTLACYMCSELCFSAGNDKRLHLTKIGWISYDPQKNFFCNGAKYERVGNQACCGGVVINETEKICCKGVPFLRFNSSFNGDEREQSCCGSTAIFKDENVCCEGKAIKLTEEQNRNRQYLQCCSTEVLADTRSEICCDGQSQSRSNGKGCCAEKPFDKRNHQCVKLLGKEVKINLDQRVCHDKVYNVTEKSCCYGTLYDSLPEIICDGSLNPHFGCCSNSLMDPTIEKCCLAGDENVFTTHTIPKDPIYQCCGNGSVDGSCQICVNGRVESKSRNQKTCGKELINTLEQDCCAMEFPYNKSSQNCCTGARSSVISANQTCCNGAGVGENQLCCNNIKPCEKKNKDDNECCFNFTSGEGQSYNSQKEQCQDGSLKWIPDHQMVCGNQSYNPKTQICCSEGGRYELTHIESGNYNCCGSTPFNEKKQACCYGRLFNIPTDQALCCPLDMKAYRYHDNSSECTKLCPRSNTHYDLNNETCCEKIVYGYRDHGTCCGSYYLNKKGRGQRSWDCCDNRELFSSLTSVCQEGMVKSRRKIRFETQAVCHRSQWKSIDNVAQHACSSRQALIGKLKPMTIDRKAIKGSAVARMTLIQVKPFQIGLNRNSWKGPKRLNFEIHVPMDPTVKCPKRIGYRRRVVVFFNAPVRNKKVTVGAGESFRVVREWVARKLDITQEFCDKVYPGVLEKPERHGF
ncbi:galaxin [Plakobranchus ocellatus]|uniref:Galaxin n=1 Tax=Plakobranchus ocellatus TaxID=259542 RepID=A0AAV3YK02_9GAST|nr:galaxin [Plakobranchus ocellatus]